MMQQSNSLHADLNLHLHKSFCEATRETVSTVMNSKAQYPGGCVNAKYIVSEFPGNYQPIRNNWATTFHFAQTG